MHDQMEQPSQTLPVGERRTDRDLQRAALRDLVALASECARTESEIELRHKTELENAEQTLDKTLFVTEQRAEHLKEQVREKHTDHTGKIATKFEEDLGQLKDQDRAMRQRIETDFEKSEKELRDKLQQATWLADSVLEATQNQLRDESVKGKRDATSHNELLDGLENRAAR